MSIGPNMFLLFLCFTGCRLLLRPKCDGIKLPCSQRAYVSGNRVGPLHRALLPFVWRESNAGSPRRRRRMHYSRRWPMRPSSRQLVCESPSRDPGGQHQRNEVVRNHNGAPADQRGCMPGVPTGGMFSYRREDRKAELCVDS